ncbi:MAG: chitinase, partial [Gemmatimonadota bacterium]|nr:chitinase [Gemmatimonadota bacterium]
MRPLTLLLATAAVASADVACTPSARTSDTSIASTSLRVVGYLASWGVESKGTRIADLPARDLTHIFYAFARIDENGKVALGDPCIDVGACA